MSYLRIATRGLRIATAVLAVGMTAGMALRLLFPGLAASLGSALPISRAGPANGAAAVTEARWFTAADAPGRRRATGIARALVEQIVEIGRIGGQAGS